MATRAENIETRLDAIAAELAAMDATQAGGLPDQSGAGPAIEHVEYRMSLVNEFRELTAALVEVNTTGDAAAWEVTSEMSA